MDTETLPATDPPAQPSSTPKPENEAPVVDAVLGKIDELTDAEQVEFLTCEAVIAQGWQNFGDVGLALARIRQGQLYRAEYDSFEAYCQTRWQDGRRYVNYQIAAAQVVASLGTICSLKKPDHEAQVRPLIGLTLDQAKSAWQLAQEKAGDRKVTARLIKAAIAELHLGNADKSATHPPKLNKAKQRRLINDSFTKLMTLVHQQAGYDRISEELEVLHGQIQGLF